ncbi:hypothetical protein [Flavobacterium wongokense]|uniref:hypothetical protein n=1 Tax=Flavobacterium wongokense TaxID=2910674 RepID=UPI001F2C0E8C|nr:hypothetical protein [Flavobacterium sp. WG47]MCF6130938.1 hypothetical protein [Flavobacterium sp. WG47]
MRKIILTGLLLVIVLGIGGIIGYEIGKKPVEHGIVEGDNGNTHEKFDKLNYTQLLTELKKRPDNFAAFARVLGSHRVCEKDYLQFQSDFWKGTTPMEKEIDVNSFILSEIPNSSCGFADLAEFNPDSAKNLNISPPKCTALMDHDRLTSCYPKSMFDYFNYLHINHSYRIYITKGLKDIELADGSIQKDVTIIMFRVENKTRTYSSYYDIVDDPTFEPEGEIHCLP